MEPASICYFEIPAPDIEKAGNFYSSVFGWDIEISDLTDQKYLMFSSGKGSLAGGLDPSKVPSKDGVLIYIKVDDILSTLETVKKAGGSMVHGKTEISGGYGFFSVFKDPNGNFMGLWSQQ